VDTNGDITPVAGGGRGIFPGDGGPATNAYLNNPVELALDSIGNLFIADEGDFLVRKVDTNGMITTVAGGGGNYPGDGGAATNAYLQPTGVAVDMQGDLFVAEVVNGEGRVLEVSTNGTITAVAGNGSVGYSGDGDSATSAEFNDPAAVAVDFLGNLFIADVNNNRIREVNSSDIVTTVAGNGSYNYTGDGSVATNASIAHPSGVTVDATGNLFIADYGNNVIRKVIIQGPMLVLSNVNPGNSGTYRVVVSSQYGSVTSAVVNLIITSPFQFTATPTNGLVPLAIQFAAPGIDGAGNALKQWNWTFGDGTTSTNQNPVHVYASAGTFQPSLLATNSLGVAVAGYGPSVTVALPMVVYSASPTSGLGPLSVQFTSPGSDSGGNVIRSWNWAFEDGTTSTGQNPSHVYTSAGNFQPGLVVTNSNGYALSASGPGIQVRVCAVSAPQGLVSWWTGDGNAGDSISGNNGIPQGGVIYTNGVVGQAFSFNGTDAYLNTSQIITNPQNFSLAMWFKTTTTQGGLLVGFSSSQTGNSSTYDRHIYMDDAGLLHFGNYTTGFQVINSTASYNDGTWHYVVAILCTNAGASLFVDGQLLENNPAYTSAYVYNGYWRVGENNLTSWPSAPSSPYFAGAMDELMVFNRALSSSEIQAIYQAGTNGVCPPAPLRFTGSFSLSRTNGVVLSASLRSGQSYHLQSNTNLASTNWITLTNFIAGTAPISHLTNQPLTNTAIGFYRLVSP
jgi:PKD repeat protein